MPAQPKPGHRFGITIHRPTLDLSSMTPGTVTTGVTGWSPTSQPFAATSFDELHLQSSATLLEQSGLLSTPTIIISADGYAVYKHRPEFGISVVEEDELEDASQCCLVAPSRNTRHVYKRKLRDRLCGGVKHTPYCSRL